MTAAPVGCRSTAAMKKLILPPSVKTVIILADVTCPAIGPRDIRRGGGYARDD